MRRRATALCLTALPVMFGASWLQGCTAQVPGGHAETAKGAANSAERNCLIRAMYFESNRSSRDGLMAVGTVVMNRVGSPLHPDTICGVVGEPHQFAAGVLTRPLNKKELPLVERAADAVLKGERYAPVGNAMHFHVAGLDIPYRVRYVAVAGGNAFYLKTDRRFENFRGPRTQATTRIDLTQGTSKTRETTLADATPKPDLMQWLYASFVGPANR